MSRCNFDQWQWESPLTWIRIQQFWQRSAGKYLSTWIQHQSEMELMNNWLNWVKCLKILLCLNQESCKHTSGWICPLRSRYSWELRSAYFATYGMSSIMTCPLYFTLWVELCTTSMRRHTGKIKIMWFKPSVLSSSCSNSVETSSVYLHGVGATVVTSSKVTAEIMIAA